MAVVLPAGRVRSAGQQSSQHTKWGLCSRTVTQEQQSVDEERSRLPVQFIWAPPLLHYKPSGLGFVRGIPLALLGGYMLVSERKD
jgi:hypothetical protein